MTLPTLRINSTKLSSYQVTRIQDALSNKIRSVFNWASVVEKNSAKNVTQREMRNAVKGAGGLDI